MNEIAVLQMGKCGSTTVIEFARRLGIHASRAYCPITGAQAEFRHVVSMVREPVARNISDFFYRKAGILATTQEEFSQALVDEFLMLWDGHDVPLEWFPGDFRAETGVDVYARRFDRKRGWDIYGGSGRRILVIRTENLTGGLGAAFEALLETDLGLSGNPFAEVEHLAKDSERPHGVGALFSEFMEKAVMPEAYLERMYGSEYARHFYYKKELDVLREFWSAARCASS